MQQSANYGLYLPEGTDNVKRQNFVDNFTNIDTQMKAINDNSYPNVTATGTNTYIGSTDRIKSLGKGTKLTLFVTADANGNCSLNLNSYGDKNIKDSFGNIVTNLKANIPYNLCYNGTDFILQGKGGGGNATAAQLALGAKATVDSGPIVGTMPINGALGTVLAINGSYTIPAGITTGGVVTQSIATKGAATITPGTSNQTIAANQYLTDVQTVLGDADLIQSNIISTANIFNVQGNATIESLGGRQYLSGSFSHTSGTQNTYTLPFTPSVIMLQQVSTGLWYMWGNHMPNINFCSLVAPPAYIGTFLYSDNVITVSSSTATSTIAWYIWA